MKRAAWQPALWANPEIERLGQGYITIVVRISIPIVVGSLPTEEFIVLRVTFLFLPGGQQLLGQRRAKVVTDEYFEQFDFSQTPPEIVAAQCPGARTILNGRFFIVFVAGNSLLENVYTFVNQRIFVLRFIDKGPSQLVGAKVQTQYFCHMKNVFSVKLNKKLQKFNFFTIFVV